METRPRWKSFEELSSASPTSLALSFVVPIVLVTCIAFVFAIVLKPSHKTARLRVTKDNLRNRHVPAPQGSSEVGETLKFDREASMTRPPARQWSTKKRDSASRGSIAGKKKPSRGPKIRTREMEPSSDNDWETTLSFNRTTEQKRGRASTVEKAMEDKLRETTPEQ